jgi:molybdopterin-guanine dinucleotide biosynthesis adapter protein
VKLKLRSSHRIVDARNRIIMAEGRMALLEAIVSTGSINQAAKQMGMSYKSAWSKIRSTEAHFKTKIVHSHKARGTRLTSAGEDLLAKYKRMKQQCLAADDAIFDRHFNGTPPDDGAMSIAAVPMVSFVGHSGCGKTTFIEKLIPLLTRCGVKVGIIKHDVHGFEMDKPGKDTWRHKRAGAVGTIVSSSSQIGLVLDTDHDHLPHELAPLLVSADLIIVEGYKSGSQTKIEVFRPHATGDQTPLCLKDPQLIAVISDAPLEIDQPVFGTRDIASVAAFLREHFSLDV